MEKTQDKRSAAVQLGSSWQLHGSQNWNWLNWVTAKGPVCKTANIFQLEPLKFYELDLTALKPQSCSGNVGWLPPDWWNLTLHNSERFLRLNETPFSAFLPN